MSEDPRDPPHEHPRGPGRPRCEASRKAILAAAYALLKEKPLPEITSTALAKRAGVSKATLYRWWSSKEAIVLEGYFETLDEHFCLTESSNALADLRAHLRAGYGAMAGPDGAIFATLVASGHFHPDVRAALNEHLNSPRCQDTERILRRAIESGQLRADLDVELAAKLLFAPLFGRLMTGEPIEPGLPDRILDLALGGMQPRG